MSQIRSASAAVVLTPARFGVNEAAAQPVRGHVSGAHALMGMSESMNSLVAALKPSTLTSKGPDSPRRKRVWDMIVECEDLSLEKLAAARRIFHDNSELAQEYMSFPDHKQDAQRCRGTRSTRTWEARKVSPGSTQYGQC